MRLGGHSFPDKNGSHWYFCMINACYFFWKTFRSRATYVCFRLFLARGVQESAQGRVDHQGHTIRSLPFQRRPIHTSRRSPAVKVQTPQTDQLFFTSSDRCMWNEARVRGQCDCGGRLSRRRGWCKSIIYKHEAPLVITK
jgi:hypothetical protein